MISAASTLTWCTTNTTVRMRSTAVLQPPSRATCSVKVSRLHQSMRSASAPTSTPRLLDTHATHPTLLTTARHGTATTTMTPIALARRPRCGWVMPIHATPAVQGKHRRSGSAPWKPNTRRPFDCKPVTSSRCGSWPTKRRPTRTSALPSLQWFSATLQPIRMTMDLGGFTLLKSWTTEPSWALTLALGATVPVTCPSCMVTTTEPLAPDR
mmetsp:Transcript_17821/g.26151  ORF Transcript_17821/g.26151 Transcript_17821/m.26151 type:complete len:211 (+) Transcript_17821:922-1554(+)